MQDDMNNTERSVEQRLARVTPAPMRVGIETVAFRAGAASGTSRARRWKAACGVMLIMLAGSAGVQVWDALPGGADGFDARRSVPMASGAGRTRGVEGALTPVRVRPAGEERVEYYLGVPRVAPVTSVGGWGILSGGRS